MNALTDWMITSSPWIEYRVRLDLLDQEKNDAQVMAAKQIMMGHPKIQNLLQETNDWPGGILKRHNDANHVIHKLTFLADLGWKIADPGIEPIAKQIMAHPSSEGPFQVMVNIAPGYGGTGEDQWAWMLCDAPLILYALIKFGLREESLVQTAVHSLTGLIQENGWPCTVAKELGKFRGPGRKGDPCPLATLMMLKTLSQMPDIDPQIAQRGAETILQMWEQRREKKYYLFAMGTDFQKLKAPLIWFDILQVLDILSQFAWVKEDDRFREMVSVLEVKADGQGRFTAESVWTSWKDWEFGQKKAPSPLITFYAHRILKRVKG